LQGAHFSLLCIPPLERDRDVGMSTLFVAARLCRQQHAMLVVDPPHEWTSAGKALDGMRRWPFHSSDALMYFPRVIAQDRLRGRNEIFASCGAVAGMLARRDRLMPVWQDEEGDAVPLRPTLRPAVTLQDEERVLLATYGVNTFGPARGAALQQLAPRSLGATLGAALEPRLLAGRRLTLLVNASVERGTRWVLYGTADAHRRKQVAAQVLTLLQGLAADGAFAQGPEACFVICDERLNGPGAGRAGEFRLLYGYAPLRSGEFQAWLTTHRPGGSVTRAVTVNRMATMGERVEVEVQSSILRGLSL
jgi:phage tail sheath protein FI